MEAMWKDQRRADCVGETCYNIGLKFIPYYLLCESVWVRLLQRHLSGYINSLSKSHRRGILVQIFHNYMLWERGACTDHCWPKALYAALARPWAQMILSPALPYVNVISGTKQDLTQDHAKSRSYDTVNRARTINEDDIGVFKVELALSEIQKWLVYPNEGLFDVNGAMDEAASFAADHGRSYVLVEIVKAKAP